MTRINTAKNDPKKTWRLINELSSRKANATTNVKTIKHDEAEITNSADIANAFNTYFTTIGDNLANNIPNSDVMHESIPGVTIPPPPGNTPGHLI
jgi:hypothetical protein